MRVLWFLAAGSAALLFLALASPGLRDWVMLSGPCLVASIYLIFRHYFLAPDADGNAVAKPSARPAQDPRRPRILPRRFAKKPPAWIVVDGSNVMHWNDGKPSLDTLRWVLEDLSQRGFVPGVIFDANAGYKIKDRYLDDDILAKELGLPEAQVLVVPKGTPADQYILEIARKLGARVVTNDRFRDWADQFPEVHRPDFLVRGGARPGHVWLDETARVPEGV